MSINKLGCEMSVLVSEVFKKQILNTRHKYLNNIKFKYSSSNKYLNTSQHCKWPSVKLTRFSADGHVSLLLVAEL